MGHFAAVIFNLHFPVANHIHYRIFHGWDHFCLPFSGKNFMNTICCNYIISFNHHIPHKGNTRKTSFIFANLNCNPRSNSSKFFSNILTSYMQLFRIPPDVKVRGNMVNQFRIRPGNACFNSIDCRHLFIDCFKPGNPCIHFFYMVKFNPCFNCSQHSYMLFPTNFIIPSKTMMGRICLMGRH